jgi:predicted negative regulator of RcsB-dependent stress response
MSSDAPPSAGFYNFLGWFETNKKPVAIGVGVILVVGVAVGLWTWHKSQREVDAEEALSSVRMPYSPVDTPPPGTAEAFAKVASDYSGTSAAAKALLRSATVYFDQNNYAKAREQFDRYLREFGDTPWVAQAVFGIAACLDAENKTTEAIQKYNDFVSRYPNDPAADQARLSLARLYDKTGQPALALDLLTKMAGPGAPQSAAAAEVQEKIRELYAKYPMLAAPPAPRPPTTPQPAIVPGNTSGAPMIQINPAPGATAPTPKIQITPAPAQPATPGK